MAGNIEISIKKNMTADERIASMKRMGGWAEYSEARVNVYPEDVEEFQYMLDSLDIADEEDGDDESTVFAVPCSWVSAGDGKPPVIGASAYGRLIDAVRQYDADNDTKYADDLPAAAPKGYERNSEVRLTVYYY